MWETFCFSSLFFVSSLSVYKEFVIDCIFCILKLYLIIFFGTLFISISTKNKLMMIIKMIIIIIIWNLWSAHLLYLYIYLQTFTSEAYWHLELRFRNLFKEVFLKHIKIFGASTERSNMSSVFWWNCRLCIRGLQLYQDVGRRFF